MINKEIYNTDEWDDLTASEQSDVMYQLGWDKMTASERFYGKLDAIQNWIDRGKE